ncbi:MAG: hypothetical protein ACI4D8_03410 [Wujia sp.]
MDRAKKTLITIVIDLILVGLVVFAVIFLLKGNINQITRNILTWGIVVCIPVGFGITCWNILGDRYDNLKEPDTEEEQPEDEQPEDEQPESKLPDNSHTEDEQPDNNQIR